ncbi:hypothetical protein PAXRUDRAFT_710590 [Paxillus rubicundulus Ve08.2h10]|uniref:Epoxide hydrolase N-terminal domain-containing protein n=1 Tax=Paxillus rubicundulus Ve08.2h10 TaxID=930991 RepID=A0A0D0CIM7_9AGAM|nr:hypothetical protein PAXRUDRAFT_710590 [Paxillus rubicundulus Ve08.2h10]
MLLTNNFRSPNSRVPPDELEDAGWKYGAPLADIRRLVRRWTHGYDWCKQEKELNDDSEMPIFARDIDVDGFGTLTIHYVHKNERRCQCHPPIFLTWVAEAASAIDCVIPGAPAST